jgi:hypothetical protein
MRDASSADPSMLDRAQTWRELYRCDDLRQARAVATTIAAMEFDVRLCSRSPADIDDGADSCGQSPGMAMPGLSAMDPVHGGACNRITVLARDEDDELPGPYAIEVRDDTWPQLADVLFEIIAEQQEFDQMLEWRRQRNHVRLVLVLSATTAAEVFLIWRLLES